MSIEPLLEKVKSNEASSVRLNSTPSVTPYTTVSLVLKANKNKHCHVYPSLKNLKPASKGCLFAFLCTGKRQVPCLLQQTLCKGDVSVELIVVVSYMMNNDEKIKNHVIDMKQLCIPIQALEIYRKIPKISPSMYKPLQI